jgi:D-3-phosphoglycerate dehydrogenase
MKILVTPATFTKDSEAAAMKKLKAFSDSLVFNPTGKPLSEDALIPLLDGCEGCIAGLDEYTAKVIESAKSLKVISRYGVGVDQVDLLAAKANNVVVCNTPGANAQAVADLTFGLLLCLARKIPILDRKTREGEWPHSNGTELYGKTTGILGLGAVGKAVAKRASGFSMRIIAYDPFINMEFADANGVISADFDTVTREADFLCLHMPLTDETRGVISLDVMKTMKKGAVIVNTARSGLIDEAAAYELLSSGHLGGLGLDVYDEEPPKRTALFGLSNVVLTPHTAAHTVEAIANMAEMAVQNLIDVISGRDCRYVVRE